MINRNPEENSDLDSDSEINPLDTFNTDTVNTKTGVSPDNVFLKKTIKLSIIGPPSIN
jgi:hypothetical protein